MPRSKHTVLDKLVILDELTQSKTGLGPVDNRHGVDHKTLERWRNRYSRDGINGLKEAKKNKHYSKELKLKVVHAYLIGESTFDELANKFGLRGSQQVVDWVNKYNGNKLLTAPPSRKRVPAID
ncbi:helix-turn-helix domain-containing protein [Loigolactobacillus coryniformis]|uniref:helix-turn-helix domain-containing protein n=1 Tax=Loigolactobacillus coryniformis TaxID=1610 RepID=UPI000C1FC9ED|nr:helix-turn-helix domain-containing protein [Loigolactobacillus coryniformis]